MISFRHWTRALLLGGSFVLLSGYFGGAWAASLKANLRSQLCRALLEPQDNHTVLPAGSEQLPAWNLGRTPLELAVGRKEYRLPRLPHSMKERAETIVHRLAQRLGTGDVTFTAWPTYDDRGRPRWVFAQYRDSAPSHKNWQWLDESLWPEISKMEENELPEHKLALVDFPILPRQLNFSIPSQLAAVFGDPLKGEGLYDKPVLGNAVILDGRGFELEWPSPSRSREILAQLSERAPINTYYAKVLPQPSQLDEMRFEFHIQFKNGTVQWIDRVTWTDEQPPLVAEANKSRAVIAQWPATFEKDYQEDVEIFSGRIPVTDPDSRAEPVRFTRKNNAEPGQQLEQVGDYLIERYKTLGLPVVRQQFRWNNQTHSNVIAIIPGTLPPSQNRPVLLADHIDTAFAEDIFARHKHRVSTAGADDNATATATLLRAADILNKLFQTERPLHDIWLVHLTGEEYPADSLGARHLIEALLRAKQKITGLVLLDMIGFRARCKNECSSVFQINLGAPVESADLAEAALQAVRVTAPRLTPVIRGASDPRSYLFNSDGIRFADAGFPTVLFNEHLNFHEHFDRPHYHESTDTIENVDVEYASQIARVAIETVARLAIGQTGTRR